MDMPNTAKACQWPSAGCSHAKATQVMYMAQTYVPTYTFASPPHNYQGGRALPEADDKKLADDGAPAIFRELRPACGQGVAPAIFVAREPNGTHSVYMRTYTHRCMHTTYFFMCTYVHCMDKSV